MKADHKATVRREFPDRIEIADIAPPNAYFCELEIVPEDEEGKVAVPTAIYRREWKGLSFRLRLAIWVFTGGIVVAHLFHVID